MVVVAARRGGMNGGGFEVVAGEVVECHQNRRLYTPNKDDLPHNDNVTALNNTAAALGRNSGSLLLHFPVGTKENVLELQALRLQLLACTHSNRGIPLSSRGIPQRVLGSNSRVVAAYSSLSSTFLQHMSRHHGRRYSWLSRIVLGGKNKDEDCERETVTAIDSTRHVDMD